jgi:hypothetical protein
VVERLCGDTGYDPVPVYARSLENAAQQSFVKLVCAITPGEMGLFLHRMAPPGGL